MHEVHKSGKDKNGYLVWKERGEDMAKETIERVRGVENEADEIEQKAKMEAVHIRAIAEDKIREMQEENEKKIQEMKDIKHREAREKVSAYEMEKLAEAEAACADLEKTARQKIEHTAKKLAAFLK